MDIKESVSTTSAYNVPRSLIFPATSKISLGIVDPIPTLPRESTMKLSSST